MNTRKKILVVEDEQLLLRALCNKLKQEGFHVLEAINGKKGLEKALIDHPDMILLDIVMPVMDGLTMLKGLRKYDWGKAMPVIVLTNLIDAAVEEETIDRNVADYLVKADWRLDDIVQKIKDKFAQGEIAVIHPAEKLPS